MASFLHRGCCSSALARPLSALQSAWELGAAGHSVLGEQASHLGGTWPTCRLGRESEPCPAQAMPPPTVASGVDPATAATVFSDCYATIADRFPLTGGRLSAELVAPAR